MYGTLPPELVLPRGRKPKTSMGALRLIYQTMFIVPLTNRFPGVAAMMALDLGLHKSASGLPLVEHERRVRVFWNIFVYEK